MQPPSAAGNGALQSSAAAPAKQKICRRVCFCFSLHSAAAVVARVLQAVVPPPPPAIEGFAAEAAPPAAAAPGVAAAPGGTTFTRCSGWTNVGSLLWQMQTAVTARTGWAPLHRLRQFPSKRRESVLSALTHPPAPAPSCAALSSTVRAYVSAQSTVGNASSSLGGSSSLQNTAQHGHCVSRTQWSAWQPAG